MLGLGFHLDSGRVYEDLVRLVKVCDPAIISIVVPFWGYLNTTLGFDPEKRATMANNRPFEGPIQ